MGTAVSQDVLSAMHHDTFNQPEKQRQQKGKQGNARHIRPLFLKFIRPFPHLRLVTNNRLADNDRMRDEEKTGRQIRQIQAAYTQLEAGAKSLLGLNAVYWTEKYLLKLVLAIARQRLMAFADLTGMNGT